MHESLFAFPSTLARYRSALLVAERERFLQHCAEQGYTRNGLGKIAWLLRIVAQSPLVKQRVVRRADLDRMARASGSPCLIFTECSSDYGLADDPNIGFEIFTRDVKTNVLWIDSEIESDFGRN